MSDVTESELARIEERCEAATAGPWTASVEGRDHMAGDTFIQTAGEDLYLTPGASVADHDFIASARQNLPRLIRVLRGLDELTDSELARIEQRCEAATPGPWTSLLEGRDHDAGPASSRRPARLYLYGATQADYDFIASARQDVPRLLRAVRALLADRG